MKLIKNNWVLVLILILAAALRFYQLAINPPHLTPDEAALGYNAFSIFKTGRDEYGELLPIIFKSFGDFKPGFYIYATVPFVGLLGLNEFSVRAASALSGVVAVWLIYIIVGEFEGFGDRRKGKGLALLSALLLAISPWHIHFSRGAWEVNLSLTFTLAGIYCFLRVIRGIRGSKVGRWMVLSAFLFAFTLITYQGAKMSTLIVLIALSIAYFGQVKELVTKNSKIVVVSIAIGLVVVLPIILSFFRGQTGRLAVFSVFSYRRPPEYLALQLDQAQIELNSPKYYLYYSEALTIGRGVIGRWFNHISPRFLFFEGDWMSPRHSAPDHGVLFLVDAVFLIAGILFLIRSKNRGAVFLLLWLVLAPFPSAFSRDQVHALRALNMVIPLVIVVSTGICWVLEKLDGFGWMRYLGRFGILGVYVLSLLYFLDAYFVHQPIHNSQHWMYGYKQVVESVSGVQDQYERIHVAQSFDQPYIYFLFYQKYDPHKYQLQANLIESEYGDVGMIEHLDNIDFLPIDWAANRGDIGTLFVGSPSFIPPQDSNDPEEFEVVDQILYLDGNTISQRLVEIKEKPIENNE